MLVSPKGGPHAYHRAAKQAAFCDDKPKAPFKPAFEVATTRKGSDVALVHDPQAEPQIVDQPPAHGHGEEAASCSWWRRGREPVSEGLALKSDAPFVAGNYGLRWSSATGKVSVLGLDTAPREVTGLS